MVEKSFGNYNSCCRLCLSENHGSLRSVFDDTSGCQALVNKISTFVGVMIYADDKLSTMICHPCIKQVDTWLSFRKTCNTNQKKLSERLTAWKNSKSMDSLIEIKDEPEDSREEDVDHEHTEVNLVDLEPIVQLKPEPFDEEAMDEELPPPLTPQRAHENGMDVDDDGYVGNMAELVDVEISPRTRKSNRHCSICNKMFSTSGNRRKHERTIHGMGDGRPSSQSVENSETGSILSQDEDGSQHSIESQIRSTELTLINEQPEVREHIETDREKIVFAAGLKLQQRNATPLEVVLDANGLTRIELSYVEKCRAMVVMFETLVCACHGAAHRNIKRLFSHLRSLKIWFPIFTCYNCMITFTDRSTNMRHKGLCQRKPLQHLVRLSELRKNDDIKRRLYQVFKCVQCKFLFSFYEDFCTHVDAEHVPTEGPIECTCLRTFDKPEHYAEHVHKSCLLNYYCDICFVIMENPDEFERHCKDVHDAAEGFVLQQNDNYQPRKPLVRNEMSPPDLGVVGVKRVSKPKPYPPQQEQTGLVVAERRVLNPHAFSPYAKTKASSCPLCGKVYSNYHNMLRHYKTHDDGEKTIPCYDCDEKFRLMSELKQHRAEVHSQSNNYMFTCPDCGDLHQGLTDWELHKASHEKQTCGECNKEFVFKTELEQHRSVHLNLKVYRDSKTQSYRSTILSPSNVMLMCEVCDLTFASKEELRDHKVAEHHGVPEIKMENGVENEVDDKKDLSKKYTCTLCNKHYLGYGGLWDHNKKKHPGRQITHDYPRQCKYCDKLLYTGGSWVIHKRMHERLTQQQQQQQQPSTSADKNARSADDTEDESYYTCKRCFKVFSSRYNLKNHMKCHGINATTTSPSRTQAKANKQVWCDICHQPCQGLAELALHKEEHKNENMPELDVETEDVDDEKVTAYTCDLCDEVFASNAALTKHKHTHEDRANHVYCKYCKIPFRSQDVLSAHMLSEHDESSRRPAKQQLKKYPCNFCKKVFDTAGGLCSHQGWHKRGKMEAQVRVQEKIFRKPVVAEPPPPRFRCQKCPSEFSNDTALQIHVLEKHRNVNATIVPPRCTQCGVEFDTHEAYEKHKQLHLIVERKKELQKQHPCQYCSAGFSRSDTLNAHVRLHHGEFYAKHFRCHLCERVFEKQNALTIHLKVHERQSGGAGGGKAVAKGLSCSVCQIVFQDSKDLRKHVFSAHPF